MAWCRQATSHYLIQCLLITGSPGVRCCFWLNLSFDWSLHKSCLNFWLKSTTRLKSETAPHPSTVLINTLAYIFSDDALNIPRTYFIILFKWPQLFRRDQWVNPLSHGFHWSCGIYSRNCSNMIGAGCVTARYHSRPTTSSQAYCYTSWISHLSKKLSSSQHCGCRWPDFLQIKGVCDETFRYIQAEVFSQCFSYCGLHP